MTGLFCTVETHDNLYLGTIRKHPHDPDSIIIHTGLRGHPQPVLRADIIEILPVDSRNPHVVWAS